MTTLPAAQVLKLLPVEFTIPWAPRTKKNHGWRTKSGKQMPSHAFMEWNAKAQIRLIPIRQRGTIQTPVNCRALIYRDRLSGDAVGYYQALADALEDARVVHDDVLIVSWDGSRLLKDAKNPRVEVVLTEAQK